MDQGPDIRSIIRRVPGWEDRPVVVEAAIPVLASPSWRGVDGAPLVARDTETGATLFVKHLHEDTGFYIEPDHAFEAARIAGETGVGPRVLVADAQARVRRGYHRERERERAACLVSGRCSACQTRPAPARRRKVPPLGCVRGCRLPVG